jgi:ATP-binding cassette subfamily C protein
MLLFLRLILLFTLATVSLLDRVCARLLVRAGVQLDASLAPAILDASLGTPSCQSRGRRYATSTQCTRR